MLRRASRFVLGFSLVITFHFFFGGAANADTISKTLETSVFFNREVWDTLSTISVCELPDEAYVEALYADVYTSSFDGKDTTIWLRRTDPRVSEYLWWNEDKNYVPMSFGPLARFESKPANGNYDLSVQDNDMMFPSFGHFGGWKLTIDYECPPGIDCSLDFSRIAECGEGYIPPDYIEVTPPDDDSSGEGEEPPAGGGTPPSGGGTPPAPPVCTDPIKITSFMGSGWIFDPGRGGAVNFDFETDRTADGYEITVNGEKLEDRTWSGKIEEKYFPDVYEVGLKVWTGDGTCSDEVLLSVPLLLDKPCQFEVDFGSTANIASGNLSHRQELFSTTGAGLQPELTINYGSMDGYNGPLGIGWHHNYDIALQESTTGQVLVNLGNGTWRLYTPDGDEYVSHAADGSKMSGFSDGTFLLTFRDGTEYLFNSDGRISSIVDGQGNSLAFQYDNSQLDSVVGPGGRSVLFQYDASGKLSTITDPGGQEYYFGYTGDVLVKITYPGGGEWTFTYDDKNYLISKTDPEGHVTLYGYDSEHRVVSATDPQGQTRTMVYPEGDGPVKTVTMIEKDGGTWQYTFDSGAGALTSRTNPEGKKTFYTYGPNGTLLSQKGPSGATTSYTYDSFGNVTSITDPLGQTISYTYDPVTGKLANASDAQGTLVSYTYDDHGNLESVTDASGQMTRYEVEDHGYVSAVINPLGQRTAFTYDLQGNIISASGSAGGTILMTYDDNGRLLTRTDSEGTSTKYEYDSVGNLVKVVGPPGGETAFAYDKVGNLISRSDANGHTTVLEYNGMGQIVSIKDALGQVTTFGYGGGSGCPSCGGGTVLPMSVTDAGGNRTTFAYDLLGRLVSETDPLGNTVNFTYDAQGNLAAKTDATGNTIEYRFDPLGRLLEKTYPDGTKSTFTYDSRGKILSAGNENIFYTFQYDKGGRLMSVKDSKGYDLFYQYNELGQRKHLAGPFGIEIEYAYNDASQLTQILSPAGDLIFDYDELGHRRSLTFPNGVTAQWGYDRAGNLANLVHQGPGGIVARSEYTYDPAGIRLSKTTEQRTTTYSYDPIYQLTAAVNSTPGFSSNEMGKGKGIVNAVENQKEYYLYGKVGNRLDSEKVHAYLYNEANQLLRSGEWDYLYAPNGSLVRKTHPTEGGSTYEWDWENRLRRVARQNGTTVEYSYDPFGRRVYKKVLKDGEVKTTRFVYDGEDILFESDGGGTVGNIYIHGPAVDEPLALKNGKGSYYYHADGLGSIVTMTDAKGKVVQQYEYDSFGNLHDQKNRIKQPFAFAGREWDKEAGLYYYHARYYDPLEGRFVSKDPIGFNGGDVNLYAYVWNRPVAFRDPSGLFGVDYQFTPYEFTPYEFTPYEFTPYEFTPYEFTPYEFTSYEFTPYEFAPYEFNMHPATEGMDSMLPEFTMPGFTMPGFGMPEFAMPEYGSQAAAAPVKKPQLKSFRIDYECR